MLQAEACVVGGRWRSRIHENTIRAVTYTEGSSIDAPGALVDTTFPDPAPTDRDLLVRVQAVSVNPIDTKVRQGAYKQGCEPKILGWDAAGP